MDLDKLYIYIIVGFAAQMIDGALGMAYGVSCTTFLATAGVPLKVASASVHTAEVFTTFVSGISHWKVRNIDFEIFKRLAIPGVIGGAFGAYVLVSVPSDVISPFVNTYLIVMGIIVIIRAFKGVTGKLITGRKIIPVGLFGGFCDAIGGGGWGPIVTSTMIASGHPPRYTIGSVNTAEFFVTLVQTFTFAVFLGMGEYWVVILGLAVGGVVAAPISAILCKHVKEKWLMIVVGVLIILLNVRSLVL